MTHIPFQHSYAKGGTGCYLRVESSGQPGHNPTTSSSAASESTTATTATSPVATSRLSYSQPAAAASTGSLPSDISCSDSASNDSESEDSSSDVEFVSVASPSDDNELQQVPPHTDKKKVLVTGGAGFIGSWVADALLTRGDDVVIVDEVNDYYDVRTKRSNIAMLLEKYGPNRVRFFEGDLCDAPFITRIFETEGIRWVVHMAARAGVRPSILDPFIYVHSNVEATTRLLELARLHDVKSFVFASSSSVYGGSQNEVFSETDVVDFPVSPYAATKKSCELIAHTYSHLYGLNVAGLRFFTVYGPRGRPDMAPYKFIDLVCRGQEIMQFGDGSTSRDYTYISDIVDGVIRSLDRPSGYQIYNLGNGNPVRLSTFIKLVEESVGTTAKIRVCPEQPGDVPRTCADVCKARAMLGYNPRVPFAEGIRHTVSWYKDRASAMATTIVNAENSRSLVKPSGAALDMEFCTPKGGGHDRPRAMSKPAPDTVERASRTLSHVSEPSCLAH